MKKKIILIGAFLSACLAFGKTNAQDFIDDSASFVADYKGYGKTIRIHSGETKKLIGYISVVSKQEAENRRDVKTLEKDKDYLLEKINNELEKTCYTANKSLTSSELALRPIRSAIKYSSSASSTALSLVTSSFA